MDVYIVRHAIADDRHPERWPDDSKRALTDEGVEKFRSAARGLKRLVPTVDLVLASPYTRAWHTAEILHEVADWPAPEECPELEAVRSPAEVIPVLELERDRKSVAVVGHDPHLSQLASLLLCGNEHLLGFDLKKGGVVALDLAEGRARLRWSASPRILRALDPG